MADVTTCQPERIGKGIADVSDGSRSRGANPHPAIDRFRGDHAPESVIAFSIRPMCE
jgi:hypothetical protein